MNDIDIWQNALKEINLNEAVQFVSRGKLIVETTQVELYNKIQALLNCPELEASHRFLYSLDPEELTEAEATKVCNLYKLGQDRGFIDPDADDTEVDVNVNATTDVPAVQTVQAVQPAPAPTAPQTAFTVLYSAMRNGNVVTGEAYSNAVNPRSAKADAISQLQKAGYSNIAILAIECGDPDCCGASANNVVEEPLQTPDIPDYASEDDEEDVAEDDMLDNRHHNGHIDEAGEEDEENKDAEDDKGSEEADDADAEEQDDGEDAEGNDDSEDSEDKEEKAEEPDEKLKDEPKDDGNDEELDAAEKTALKDSYKKAFKAAMLKCKYDGKKFEDLTLEEKIEFFTVLSQAWGNKADPSKFMTDKELDQLEKIVVKK